MVTAQEVLEFWLDEVGEAAWYNPSAGLDDQIRERFEPVWQAAREGTCGLWLTYPSGLLAYIILLDQLPRNMFRNAPEAFATDHAALAAAKVAIERKWDMRIDEPARQFFYLPLMHSENLCDQDRCVRLMLERLPLTGESNLLHARAHREVIRLFGRFPDRNTARGRASTRNEQDYIANGGYAETLRALQSSKAA